MTKDDFGVRARQHFENAGAVIKRDCAAMHAEHSAKGRLQSGTTARRAVAIFDERTKEALQIACDEVAGKIEHHGRRWRAAMGDVQKALADHVEAAPMLIAPSLRLAGIDEGSSAAKGVEDLFKKVAISLTQQLTAFRDGWTAPKAKLWNERNPVVYALILLVIGSIVGALVARYLPTGAPK